MKGGSDTWEKVIFVQNAVKYGAVQTANAVLKNRKKRKNKKTKQNNLSQECQTCSLARLKIGDMPNYKFGTPDNQMTTEQRKWLANICGNNVRFDESMAKHTSLRVGGLADAYVTPESIGQLAAIIQGCKERGIRYIIIGDGTNLLVKDNGIQDVVIILTKYLNNVTLNYTKKNETVIKAMAGVRMQKLCMFAINHGLEGMNMALGIPGTVGGGIMMNAGTALGSMENVLNAITILMPTGQIITINKEKMKFGYRKFDIKGSVGSYPECNIASDLQPIILEGYFCLHPCDPVKLKKEAKEILKARREKQPTSFPSAGCFFKNPVCDRTAGELIDLAGLKGERIGDAQVSEKHANFIINRGNASAADILSLAERIQETVLKKFNILLEPEVKIVG